VLYGGLGLVAVAIYLTLPYNLESAVMYDAIAGTSVLAILAGVWIHRPARPLPWLLLAAGFACFVAGEIVWHVYWFGLGQDPFPSVADVFYLAGYPLLAAGLLILARDRGSERGRERAGLLDAAIVTVAAFVVTWVFLVEPYAGDESLSTVDQILSAAYPLMDVLLLTLLVRLLFTPGRRTPAVWLLALGMACNIAADVIFLALELAGRSSTTWVEAIWLLAYLSVGSAALHPSMASRRRRRRGRRR
jgi:hypothetical protein